MARKAVRVTKHWMCAGEQRFLLDCKRRWKFSQGRLRGSRTQPVVRFSFGWMWKRETLLGKAGGGPALRAQSNRRAEDGPLKVQESPGRTVIVWGASANDIWSRRNPFSRRPSLAGVAEQRSDGATTLHGNRPRGGAREEGAGTDGSARRLAGRRQLRSVHGALEPAGGTWRAGLTSVELTSIEVATVFSAFEDYGRSFTFGTGLPGLLRQPCARSAAALAAELARRFTASRRWLDSLKARAFAVRATSD